jgi:hypothetical protein
VAIRLVRHDTDTPTLSGPAANERLTGWAGAVLFLLLAAEGVTLLALQSLMLAHIVIGLLLVGPALLKLASTGYRFLQYYSGEPNYRASGPPMILLRLLAPILIAATVLLLGTGIALLFVPASVRDVLIFLHKASFAGWFLLAAVHVLAYVWRVPRLVASDMTNRGGAPARRGAGARLTALTASILVGVVLAALLLQRAQPWVQLIQQRHHDG